jgi:transcription elongation factor Elf1
MEFFKCPYNELPPYQHYHNQRFCSAKLHCGRCLANGGCDSTIDKKQHIAEFYCDSCRYRFMCLTCAYSSGIGNYEIFKAFGEPFGGYCNGGNR